KKGKRVAVQKVRMKRKGWSTASLGAQSEVQLARASFGLEPPAAYALLAAHGSGRCCWRYRCHHPRHRRVIWIYISWDADCCCDDDDADRLGDPHEGFAPDGDTDDEGPP